MAYLFTEKKRIRKNFGKRTAVLDTPYLLEMQLDSYRAFLQQDIPIDQREDIGLQAAFSSFSPSKATMVWLNCSLLAMIWVSQTLMCANVSCAGLPMLSL